ncbi:MAG TPA: peptidase M20, partial [Phycisphaerales bacterium]|nr:peptidase M20 [Phycisphaerales bacterium]
MLDPAVRNYLEIHRAAHLDRLIELLRIPGIANRRDDACDRSARWLADALGALGFHADIVPTSTKPVVLAEGPAVDGAPTILIYGHYDVQPPEPLELWRSDPFQPVVRDGWIYARGADDDKGQLFTHLMAVEAFVRSGKGLPLNVKFYIEGEEEIGSPSAAAFLAAHGDRLPPRP